MQERKTNKSKAKALEYNIKQEQKSKSSLDLSK